MSADRWMHRLAQHGTGTALLFARTETRLWHDHIWPHASGYLFLRGRVTFCLSDGTPAKASAGAPSVLIAYGDDDAQRLAACSIPGRFAVAGSVGVSDKEAGNE